MGSIKKALSVSDDIIMNLTVDTKSSQDSSQSFSKLSRFSKSRLNVGFLILGKRILQ